MKRFQFLFDADKGGSESGGGFQLSPEVLEKFQKFVEKNGSGDIAAQILYNDNYQLRRELRELKTKVPTDGGLVLDAEQAKQWEAYQGLGAPDALTKAIKEKETAQGELAGLRKQETLRNVAEIAGWKPNVLGTLDTADGGLTYEVKTETKDGKQVKTVLVKGGKATDAMSLTDYAQAHWTDHMPALAVSQQQQQQGTRFVAQGNGTAGGNLTVEEIAKRNRATGEYRAL